MMGFVAFLILAVGVVFVLALAGGGGDDDSNPASSDKTPGASSSSGDICAGKTLIVPGDDPSSVLDPIQVGDVSTSEYIVELFDGLVTLDPDLFDVPMGLARRGDTTYVYHRDICLRCGAAIQIVELGGRACYYCPVDQSH